MIAPSHQLNVNPFNEGVQLINSTRGWRLLSQFTQYRSSVELVELFGSLSKAIPQLPKLGGFSCDYCDFLSIDKSNLRHHCSSCKPQDRKGGEKGWKNVLLQTLVKSGNVRYWIVE